MNYIKCKNVDENIEITKSKFYTIVLENKQQLRTVIDNLKLTLEGEEEEYFLYYKNEKKRSLKTDCFLITDIFSFQFDDKKSSALVQKDIVSNLTQTDIEKYRSIENIITDYLSSLTYSYNLPLQFDDDISLNDLIKFVKLSIKEESGEFLTSFINKIKVIAFTTGVNIFFILNLHEFLDQNEFNLFLKEMKSMELYPVIISSHKPTYKLAEEFQIFIDNDLCEIHVEENSKNS